MTPRTILLIGAGGHARACIDVIEQDGRFKIAGLVGVREQVGQRVLGYPVIGTDEDLPALTGTHGHALVAVGQIESPETRIRLFGLLAGTGCALPSIVSPRAYVSPHASVGAGTIVMHGSVVNTGGVIGRNCILNNQSLVEHDAVIEDHCHVAPGAVVNGEARVGEGTFIGSGSVVRNGITVGARCVIGMGQRVLADCVDGTRVPPRRGES